MTNPASHTPAVASGYGGVWRVYCLACSDAVGEYAPRCRINPDREWPPLRLVAAPEPTPQEDQHG